MVRARRRYINVDSVVDFVVDICFLVLSVGFLIIKPHYRQQTGEFEPRIHACICNYACKPYSIVAKYECAPLYDAQL